MTHYSSVLTSYDVQQDVMKVLRTASDESGRRNRQSQYSMYCRSFSATGAGGDREVIEWCQLCHISAAVATLLTTDSVVTGLEFAPPKTWNTWKWCPDDIIPAFSALNWLAGVRPYSTSYVTEDKGKGTGPWGGSAPTCAACTSGTAAESISTLFVAL